MLKEKIKESPGPAANTEVDAGAFVSRLREEQASTDERGYHSDEVQRDLRAAGILDMLRPSRYGGMEAGLSEWLETIATLSSGCPSTGLAVAATTANVAVLSALFSAEVQDAVFSSGLNVSVCTSDAAVPVVAEGGGWRLKGSWARCDGASHATWFLAPVLLPGAARDAAPTRGLALVPRAQMEIVEDWKDMLGLCGAGSHSIMLDTHVPASHVVAISWPSIVPPTGVPGTALYGSPLYDGRSATLSVGILAAVALGIGRAALDWYEHGLLTRMTPFPPRIPRSQEPNAQRFFGLARGLVLSAEGVLRDAAAQHLATSARALSGGPAVTGEEELQLIVRYQRAVQLVWEAVEILFSTGGASASRGNSQMTRYFRDLSTLRTRDALHYEGYARALSLQHFADMEAR